MQTKSFIFVRVAFVSAGFLIMPLIAQAVMYAPGETLNPACTPADPTCGVYTVVTPGTIGQVPYYAATGNIVSPSAPLTILPNGNVGIGTASPGTSLSVVGDVNVNTTSGAAFNIQDQYLSNYLTVSTASTTGDIFTVASPAGITLFTVTQAGTIGIGTVAPAGLLDVSGNSALTTLNTFDGTRAVSVINANTTNNNASGFDFRTLDTNGLLITGAKVMGVYTDHTANAASGDLAILTRNAGTVGEVMRVTGAGRVGIGTTTPFSLLSIVNSATTANNIPLLTVASTTAGTSTSTLMVILPSGNVGIGTSSPPQKFTVSGTIRQTGCITAGTLSANTAGNIICTPSSLRFKDNIQSVGAGLSEITQLRPVSYHYKPELDMGAGTRMGFIAEEVASINPAFATYDAKGIPYGLDTNALLAATVNAIKELGVRVNGDVASIPNGLQNLASGIGQASSVAIGDSLTRVSAWLGDAGNGIGDFFANRVRTKELCVGNECIGEGQLKELLDKNQIVGSAPPGLGIASTTVTTTTVETTTTTEVSAQASSTPLLPNAGTPATPPSPLLERAIDIGSSGADITALQILLMQKGFLFLPPGDTPGYFGELTRDALMQYQSSVGLTATGAVGPLTRAKLNAEFLNSQ